MTRRLLNLLTVLSLLLFAATAALWVRSHFVRDGICFRSVGDHDGRLEVSLTVLFSSGGGGEFQWSNSVNTGGVRDEAIIDSYRRPWDWTHDRVTAYPLSSPVTKPDWQAFGFKYYLWSYRGGPADHAMRRSFVVPYWFVTALLAAWPGSRLYQRLAALRRPGRGRCQVCGYDLRATPNRCPECGHDAEPETSGVTSEPEARAA